jgi:hypothetical protein
MIVERMKSRYIEQCEQRNLPELSLADLELQLIASIEGESCSIDPSMTEEEKTENLSWLRRFKVVVDRVMAEEKVIQVLCVEAFKAGYVFDSVNDGEELHSVSGCSIANCIDLLTAVDESAITFKRKQGGQPITFHLIFGNSAEELIADHTDRPHAELIWQAVQQRI